MELRADALARLGEQRFDVLVVGGGIIGAGIAEAASAHGLRVALVDKGDFAGATSSASSKLVHGGLRYLRLGDVRLVREAHQERRHLMRVLAPHLVRRQTFLLPLYRCGPYRPLVVQSGITLYQALARSRVNGLVGVDRAKRLVPDLRTEGLRSCALYADAWTNDARLTLANIRAAGEAGAAVANYAEVVELAHANGAVSGAIVVADGEEIRVRARVVVNATGPWLDALRALEDPAAGPSVRLSKGVHVTVDLPHPWEAALTIPHDKVRVTFAVPWEGMLLLGTTDTLHASGPDDVSADASDVAQVLGEAAVALDVPDLGPVRATFAGLRVLPGGDGSTSLARRETVYTRGSRGMLSVAGGKLTTYRRIALDALEHVRAELGLHRLDRSPRPLPGAAGLDRVRLPEALDPLTRSHLLHLYGSLASEVLAPARDDPRLLEPLVEGAPDIAAQARYAFAHEWARSVEDVVERRTTLALRGAAGSEAHDRVRAAAEGLVQPSRGGAS